MARATTKKDLVIDANDKFEKLNDFINGMDDKELSDEFDFSNDKNKKEAHWMRDKNLKDILIHLYEWHKLLLNWTNSNMRDEKATFIPYPYNWKTYSEMNVEFYKKHEMTKINEAKDLFIKSHSDIMNLVNEFTSEELFSKGKYEWVGGSTLGSYFVSVTASHYDWALKKLKAHRKNIHKKI